MYSISKRFDFSASHQLGHLPDGHPCARLHGHNYAVEFVFESPCLDDRGFCQLDYNELGPIRDYLDAELDHRHLNDVLPVRPTAENIARFLHGKFHPAFPFLKAVRVSETPKTWAEYRT